MAAAKGSLIMRISRASLHLGWGFVLLGVSAPQKRRYQRPQLARHWCRKALEILGIEVVVEGRIEPGCLQVANHITWIDVLVMMAAGCRGFVSKSEVASWPMIGRLTRAVDTVFIERGAWQTQAASQTMQERLLKGENVLFFPEGTTTDGRHIRQFHARLFEAAIATESCVQPLAIRYEVPGGDYNVVPYIDDVGFMENLLAIMRQPRVRAHLIACEPIAAAGYDRKRLAREARDRIVTQLAINDPALPARVETPSVIDAA